MAMRLAEVGSSVGKLLEVGGLLPKMTTRGVPTARTVVIMKPASLNAGFFRKLFRDWFISSCSSWPGASALISGLALDVATAAGSSPGTAFWTAVSFSLEGIVAGCGIVRVGMGWGGAVLDVGCSGAFAWSNLPFSEENSDSSVDRKKKRERVGNKLYIEGCRFQLLGIIILFLNYPRSLHRGSIYGSITQDYFSFFC